jgi:hypothetical protein
MGIKDVKARLPFTLENMFKLDCVVIDAANLMFLSMLKQAKAGFTEDEAWGRAGNARRVGAAGGGNRGRGRAVAQKPARPTPREATCLAAAAAAKATVTRWTPATPTITVAVLKAQAVVYAAAKASPAQ